MKRFRVLHVLHVFKAKCSILLRSCQVIFILSINVNINDSLLTTSLLIKQTAVSSPPDVPPPPIMFVSSSREHNFLRSGAARVNQELSPRTNVGLELH